MSRMAKETRSRRPRQQFDDDFKAQAVRLVLDEGKTVGSVARDLDLTETALPRRSHPGQDRPDDGRARGARSPPEREPDLAGRAGDLKNSGSLLRERAAVKFRFIATEKAQHALGLLCRCLRVTRSGFYAWQRRPESARATRDRQLKVLRASFTASKGRYESPRIYRDLRED